jgi:actin-like ATPase involved in cell morphogenesis
MFGDCRRMGRENNGMICAEGGSTTRVGPDLREPRGRWLSRIGFGGVDPVVIQLFGVVYHGLS